MKKLVILSSLALVMLNCAPNNREAKIKENFDQALSQVKRDFAPDRRDKTFEATLEHNQERGQYILRGSTTEPAAAEALVDALKSKNIEVADSMVRLPDPTLGDKTFAVVQQSVVNFRYGPNYSTESATQALMGMPLRLLEKKSGWYRANTPEGYTAWVTAGSVEPMNQEEFNAWNSAPKLIITKHYTLIREGVAQNSQVLCDAVWGDIVKNQGRLSSHYKVMLPNGKIGYVSSSDVQEFDKWLDSRNPSAQEIISTAKEFLGFPYLWGGTSIKAMDCSGLTKTVFYLNGVILKRDASQQAKTGTDVDISNGIENLIPGDFLFFGSKATAERAERITHVAIYMGNGEFIHSATSVRINSLLPDAPNYYDGSGRLVRANRIIAQIDKEPGIVSIKNHPWYFAN